MSSPAIDDLLRLCVDDDGSQMPDDAEPIGRVTCGEIREIAREISDHYAVHASHDRLVREIDVLLHGEDGAAPQASLCDLLSAIAELVATHRGESPPCHHPRP